MNDKAEGMIDGLGMAIILAHKYKKNPNQLLQALTKVTQRIQVDVARDRLLYDLEVMIVIALPIHAIGEGLAVMAFGFPIQAVLVTMIGTGIHHIIDLIISMGVIRAARPILAPTILTGIRLT